MNVITPLFFLFCCFPCNELLFLKAEDAANRSESPQDAPLAQTRSSSGSECRQVVLTLT